MGKLIILIQLLLFSFDELAIISARMFLLDFLVGHRNRKSANRIHEEQCLKDRILMGYIKPHLKRYKKAFARFHALYVFEIVTLIPQYLLVVITMLFTDPGIALLFWIGVIVFKFLLACFFRS